MFSRKVSLAGCHPLALPWLLMLWSLHGYNWFEILDTRVFHPLDCAARVGDLVLSISECLEPRTVLSTEDAPLNST